LLTDLSDSILQACVQKVDDAIYELESPAQAGNLNSTPEYTLSMIETAMNNATEFATTFNLYREGEKGGDHVDVINDANEFAQSLSDVLTNVKGITRLTQNDEASDKPVAVAKTAGDGGLQSFLNLQSYNCSSRKRGRTCRLRVLMDSQDALSKLPESVESVIAKQDEARDLVRANGDVGDIVEQEVLSAARMIEAATQKLQEPMVKRKDTQVAL